MEIQKLHTQAMDFAEQADFLKMQGKEDEAQDAYTQSLNAEKEAAYAARNQHLGEPTESILFRSAATLAYSLHDFREAERLICMGLAGNPPLEIAEELRDLYDKVSMERNLTKMDASPLESQHEEVKITIPIQERGLLNALVRKFGWACVF